MAPSEDLKPIPDLQENQDSETTIKLEKETLAEPKFVAGEKVSTESGVQLESSNLTQSPTAPDQLDLGSGASLESASPPVPLPEVLPASAGAEAPALEEAALKTVQPSVPLLPKAKDRAATFADLQAKGWDAKLANRAAEAIHPLDDGKVPATTLMQQTIGMRIPQVRTEVMQAEEADDYIERVIDATLKFYQDCAKTSGDTYYEEKFKTILGYVAPLEVETQAPLTDYHTGENHVYEAALRGKAVRMPVAPVWQGPTGWQRTPAAEVVVAAPEDTKVPLIAKVTLWVTILPAVILMGAVSATLLNAVYDAMNNDPEGMGEAVARSGRLFNYLSFVLLATITVGWGVWAAWMSKIRKDAQQFRWGSWGPVWSWAGWLVPGLNVAVPYLNLKESVSSYQNGLSKEGKEVGDVPKLKLWWGLALSSIFVTAGVYWLHWVSLNLLTEFPSAGVAILGGTLGVLWFVCTLILLASLLVSSGTLDQVSALRVRANEGKELPLNGRAHQGA